jgi:hypothetical protein
MDHFSVLSRASTKTDYYTCRIRRFRQALLTQTEVSEAQDHFDIRKWFI